MDRDRRLTGFIRGQTDRVKAPAGFELSNPWRVGVACGRKYSAIIANLENSLRKLSYKCVLLNRRAVYIAYFENKCHKAESCKSITAHEIRKLPKLQSP
jgi:hypothetical protein